MKHIASFIFVAGGSLFGGLAWSWSGNPYLLFSFGLLTVLYGGIIAYLFDPEHGLMFFLGVALFSTFLKNNLSLFLFHLVAILVWYGIVRRFLSSRSIPSYGGMLLLLFLIFFLPTASVLIPQHLPLFLFSFFSSFLLAILSYRWWGRRPSLA